MQVNVVSLITWNETQTTDCPEHWGRVEIKLPPKLSIMHLPLIIWQKARVSTPTAVGSHPRLTIEYYNITNTEKWQFQRQ